MRCPWPTALLGRGSGRRGGQGHALGIHLQPLGRDRRTGEGAQQAVDDDEFAGLDAVDDAHAVDQHQRRDAAAELLADLAALGGEVDADRRGAGLKADGKFDSDFIDPAKNPFSARVRPNGFPTL